MYVFYFFFFLECLKYKDVVYNNKLYGCYLFINKVKLYKDVIIYCQFMLLYSYLVFLDFVEKV